MIMLRFMIIIFAKTFLYIRSLLKCSNLEKYLKKLKNANIITKPFIISAQPGLPQPQFRLVSVINLSQT